MEATNFPPGTIAYVRQQEPLGLGHAVWCARHVIGDEPFAVMLPDDVILGGPPCLSQLLDVYEGLDQSDGASANLIGVEAIEPALSRKFGVLDVDQWDSEQRSFSARVSLRNQSPKTRPRTWPFSVAISSILPS